VNRRRGVTVTASTFIVAGLVTVGIAHARSAANDDVPPDAQTSLTLTLAPTGGVPTTVVLECEPAGGSHPHAEDACAALAAANGQIGGIAPKQAEMCPHLVHPVRATATGHYRTTLVDYDHTWNNSCELTRATGAVFDF
jgi:hypothetical protein